MFQDELTRWYQGSLGSVSGLEPPPGPAEGGEGWIPSTQSTNWEGEMADPILALAAFSGTNHSFTASFLHHHFFTASQCWEKLSLLFLCLLEIRWNVWGFCHISCGEVLRNIPLLEDSSQLYQ